MQRDLQQLEELWGLAVHSAGFGVWDLDVAAHRVHYPPQWKAMLGYAAEDTADHTSVWRERVHPEDLPRMVEALNAHLDGRSPAYAFEFRLRAADGSYRWVLSRGRVVERSAQGQALRAVGTLTDLTDRREAEAMRLERDRAEAASRAKTEFLSRMSHELRTPLNAVLGFAQLLSQQLGERDVAAQRRHLMHIENAGWHLLHLIDNVLDLSSLENGRLPLHIEATALAPLMQRVAAAQQPGAQQRALTLNTNLPPAEALVLADAARLEQVLTHLVDNAIKYNRAGGSVRLEAEPVPAGWRVTVVDTGVGIPAAQQRHLFEPFNRLGRRDAGVDGVGIGLALTRWLVVMMGAEISLHSRAGRGSRFSVTLRTPPAGCAPGQDGNAGA